MNGQSLLLQIPTIAPPLDPAFRPISLGDRAYRQAVANSPRTATLSIALERNQGLVHLHRTEILIGSYEAESLRYVERLVKFLLWQIGGWKLTIAGPSFITKDLQAMYSSQGARAFDAQLMEQAYGRPWTVVIATSEQDLPAAKESGATLGGHLKGCRLGFDLGASDYKLAAVMDGEPVFTTEIPWDPKTQPDPDWHFNKIQEGLHQAAKHLPRIDAIGGSSAGIILDNEVRVASLFRAVPPTLFQKKARTLFHRLQEAWQVPLEVANDGDVTALAGGLSLGVQAILGVAMGSSQAVGWLDAKGRIKGWLNEMAFTPVDYDAAAPRDEWSGDRGCGVQYFSQQAVIRLASKAGIDLPAGHPAEQLKHVQNLHQQGDTRAARIFETIGIYYGYALPHYASFYDLRHVLTLGRVTSGAGGDVILSKAHDVLNREFPELAAQISLHLPDEKSKRHGQAVAAASLPSIPAR